MKILYYYKYYSFASQAIWSLWSLKTRKRITVIYHWPIIDYGEHTPTKTYKWKTLTHLHTDTHEQCAKQTIIASVCQTYWPFRPILYKHTMLRTTVSWHEVEWFSAYNKLIQWLGEFYESKSSKIRNPCAWHTMQNSWEKEEETKPLTSSPLSPLSPFAPLGPLSPYEKKYIMDELMGQHPKGS